MSNYIAAVKRTGRDDELQHFKYIKRVKKNGKWVYYYDDSELKKFDKGYKEKYQTRSGGKVTDHEVDYVQTDKWYAPGTRTVEVNSTANWQGGSSSSKGVYKTVYQGKSDRVKAKIEKHLYDKVLSSDSKTKKSINKGKQRLSKLFSR